MNVAAKNLLDAISIHAQNISTKNICIIFDYSQEQVNDALKDSENALLMAINSFAWELTNA